MTVASKKKDVAFRGTGAAKRSAASRKDVSD